MKGNISLCAIFPHHEKKKLSWMNKEKGNEFQFLVNPLCHQTVMVTEDPKKQ